MWLQTNRAANGGPYIFLTDSEDKWEAVIASAISLGEEWGYDAVTVKGVAAVAGIAEEDILRHFPCQEGIWPAVLGWTLSRLRGLLEHAALCSGNPLHALEKTFYSHVAFIVHHRQLSQLLSCGRPQANSELFGRQVRDFWKDYQTDMAILLGQARARGLMGDAVDVGGATALLVGVFQALLRDGAGGENGEEALMAEVRKIFPVYLNGITARGGKA
jgi:AcrR family transcriptional regulator